MTKKKPIKSEKSKKLTKPEKPSDIDLDEPEKKFDFGGIPQRDLKKNLGCG